MKSFLAAAVLLLASAAPGLAQFQGVAAADGDDSSDVVTVTRRTLSAAIADARNICREQHGGRACKAIGARENNSFVVILCPDDVVHMAADSTYDAALRVARNNARSYGRRDCDVIYSD
jgi:hypothetical protein